MPQKKIGKTIYKVPMTKNFNGKQYRLLGRADFRLFNTRKRAAQSAKVHRSALHGNDAARAVRVKDRYVVYVHRRGGWGWP